MITRVQFQAPKALYATTGNLVLHQGNAQLSDIVAEVAGSTVEATGQIVNDRVEAVVTTAGVPLHPFAADLPGALSGRLVLSGPLSSFRPATVRAKGAVRFSQGLSLIQTPITAQVQWDGTQILVPQAQATGFTAHGRIGAQLEGSQAPQITTLDLHVQAQDYDVQALGPLGLPPEIALTGRADVRGQLTGTLTTPKLQAALQVKQLAVQNLGFASPLIGRLDYDQRQGVDLTVVGGGDLLQLALDSTFQPQSFDIRWNQATVTGTPQDEQLSVSVRHFPLIALQFSPLANAGLGPVSGVASGDFEVNLDDRHLQGGVVIAQPGMGPLQGDLFTGRVGYAGTVATLKQGALLQGDNHYQLEATLTPGAQPQFEGELHIRQAQIADVLAGVAAVTTAPGQTEQSSSIEGTAADVQTTPINLAQAPLYTQLLRLTELEQLFANQQSEVPPPDPFPDLTDLNGKFAGDIQFSGTSQTDLRASFDLQGETFTWGKYTLEEVIATGTWGEAGLTLEPFQIKAGDSFVAFSGRIGEQEQSGQLTLANLPVQEFTPLLALPFDVSGNLGGTTTLAGSLIDPTLSGELSLTDATLNQIPINLAQLNFDYDQSRLGFEGKAQLDRPESIILAGSIPYQWPFAAKNVPSNNQIDVTLEVDEQALALLNLFSDQVTWKAGNSSLNVLASGTLEQPIIQGALTLENVTLQSQFLSEPLTQVNGTIEFDRDRLLLPRLTGNYNEGELVATGSLPIFDATVVPQQPTEVPGAQTPEGRPCPQSGPSVPLSAQPLTVCLQDLDLNLDLYRGQIDGELLVQGTALNPTLGGTVTLDGGQVLLAQAAAQAASPPNVTADLGSAETDTALQFADLTVQLGEDVRILQPPLLDFVASGDLTLNGSVNDPKPKGTIKFRRGKVNLFTTLFLVDRRPSNRNVVQFDPQSGTDPNLDISLVTTVTSAISGRTTTLNEFDTRSTNASALDSIRIRANVKGRASELINNFDQVVELTSSPNRDRQEIVALLGGGFTEPLERGETGVALANLAGSAVSTGVQNLLSDALGSRVRLRAFPILIPDDETGDRAVLQFGGELGYDVTDRFSVSALQVLTGSDRATLFNLSYDINDELRARTAIGTDAEAVGILEFRLRF